MGDKKTISGNFEKKLVFGRFRDDLNLPHVESNIIAGSIKRKYWWECELGHVYNAFPTRSPLMRQARCPYCIGKKTLAGFNDLATSHPHLIKEWHPTKNKNTEPTEIRYSTRKKYWWMCSKGHEWEAPVLNRASGNKCYQCRGMQKAENRGFLKDDKELFSQVIPKMTPDVDLEKVKKFSVITLWWGGECGHEWDSTPARRSSGNNCPYCAGTRLLVGFNDAATRYPELKKFFVKEKNEISLEESNYGSNREFIWTGECNHEWKTSVSGRNRFGCPYCAGQRVLQGFNDLETLYPEVAAEWHPDKNGNLLPHDVHYSGSGKYWWKCSKNNKHEWDATISNRTRSSSGCPQCYANSFISKGEQEVYDYVCSILPDGIEAMQSERRLIYPLELDIYIPSLHLAIEFNGIYWHSEEVLSRRDHIDIESFHYHKWKQCKDNGISLITIWEDEWRVSPELVKRIIAERLNPGSTLHPIPRYTDVTEVETMEAKEFYDSHHLKGYLEGRHIGLRSNVNKELLALSTWDDNSLVKYAHAGVSHDAFSRILEHVSKLYPSSVLNAVSDNMLDEGGFYSQHGFIEGKQLSPKFSYVLNASRIKEDSSVEQEELSKIWDCGHSLFSLSASS